MINANKILKNKNLSFLYKINKIAKGFSELTDKSKRITQNQAKSTNKGGCMDILSMALGSTRMPDPVSRAVIDPSAKMTELAEKMLKVGLEVAVKGLEIGKGENIDLYG